MEIGIIGAGHAGVMAARRASEHGAHVTLFSAESVFPYFRPRVVAFAFGLTDERQLYMHPSEWYAEHNIDLRLGTSVNEINPSSLGITTSATETSRFDALIIACGAQPVVLPWEKQQSSAVLPLWSLNGAKTLKRQLEQSDSVTIVGGGLTGIEAALYATEQGKETSLLELKDHLLPLFLGEYPAALLREQLAQKNVVISTGTSITDVDTDASPLHVHTQTGSEFDTDLIITTVGGAPSVPACREAELDIDRGIRINKDLSTSAPGVFACGDVAQFDGWSMGNVSAATNQGRVAGDNVVGYVLGNSLHETSLSVNTMDFKHNEFEIHVAGDAPGPGRWEEELPDSGDGIYRGVVLNKANELKGVQMVGTGEGFRKLVRYVDYRWDEVQLFA